VAKKPVNRKESERRTLRYIKLIAEATKTAIQLNDLNIKHWKKAELDRICQKVYKTTNPITKRRMFIMLNNDEVVKKDLRENILKQLSEFGITQTKIYKLAQKAETMAIKPTDLLAVAKFYKELLVESIPKTQINTQFNFNNVLNDNNEIKPDLSINDNNHVLNTQETPIQKD